MLRFKSTRIYTILRLFYKNSYKVVESRKTRCNNNLDKLQCECVSFNIDQLGFDRRGFFAVSNRYFVQF